MRDTSRSRIALIVLVVLSVLAAPVSADYTAPPSLDSSTTDDTSTTSEVLDGGTISNVDGNASNSSTFQWIAPSNDTAVNLTDNSTDYEFAENTSATQVVWNSTDNDGHFNATFNHDAFLDLEHAPGENVTVDYHAINNTTSTADSVGTGQIYIDWTNTTSTETVTDAEVDTGDIVTVTDDNRTVAGITVPFTSTDKSRVELTDQSVPNGTMYIAAGNGSVADDITASLDEFDSADKASSVFGAFGANTFIKVSGGDKTRYVPVYAEDVPDSVDTGEDLYAVATSDVGGVAGVAIHNVDDNFDATDVDVTMASGVGTSGWFFGYATQGLSNAFGMTLGGGFTVFSTVPFVAGVRRRQGGIAASNTDAAAAVEV